VDPRKTFDGVRGVLAFIVFAVVVAPFATSFLDAFAVVITGWGRSYWPLGLERFSTNALAVLTIVPTIVVFSRNGILSSKRLTVPQLSELVVFAVATLLVTIAIFGFRSASTAAPVLLYAPIPLLLWATVRYGPGGLTLTSLILPWFRHGV
jgi:integral membrane sensor domain MASE1